MEPSTGYVRALIGGYDYGKSQFNRAIFARRQPGSAFKPIIYATALEQGRTPATIIEDDPITYIDESDEEWSPRNYEDEHFGPTTLRHALAYSRNVVSIKLMEDIGIDPVIKYAKELGITGEFPRNLTLALGSLSVTPIELVTAYTAFANSGALSEPIFIKKIVNAEGTVKETNSPSSTQVFSPETAFLLTSILQDAATYGTAWRARTLGRADLAAKTGSTNEFRDAWFIGFNPSLLTGVWVGHDDMTTLGEKEAGARAAGPIWVDFMGAALQDQPELLYEPPDDIISYVVNSESGLLVNSPPEELPEAYYWEFFKEGTEPRMESDPEKSEEEEQGYKIFN
jgi:penicillin-binding protein 1A